MKKVLKHSKIIKFSPFKKVNWENSTTGQHVWIFNKKNSGERCACPLNSKNKLLFPSLLLHFINIQYVRTQYYCAVISLMLCKSFLSKKVFYCYFHIILFTWHGTFLRKSLKGCVYQKSVNRVASDPFLARIPFIYYL